MKKLVLSVLVFILLAFLLLMYAHRGDKKSLKKQEKSSVRSHELKRRAHEVTSSIKESRLSAGEEEKASDDDHPAPCLRPGAMQRLPECRELFRPTASE